MLSAQGVGAALETQESESIQREAATKLLLQTEELLKASLQSLIPSHGALFPELLESYAAFESVRELDQTRQAQVVLHPSFRYWLQALRRSSRSDDQDLYIGFLRRLPEFVWALLAANGRLRRSWIVATDSRGGLRCPSLGRFVELGPSYANQRLRLDPVEEGVTIRCPDGLTVQIPRADFVEANLDPPPSLDEHGYWVAIAPRVGRDGAIEVSTRDEWLRVKITGTNQRTNGTEFFGFDDSLYVDNPAIEHIRSALDLIAEHWPDEHDDLARFSRVIVPIRSTLETNQAFTVSSRQGAIYVGQAPAATTVEMLIHENAHVKLRQIELLGSLLVDPLDETVRVEVPWRPDPRPIPGIFEGLYVFTHVAEYESRRLQAEGGKRERLVELLRDLQYAQGVLRERAQFTDRGQNLLGALDAWIDNIANR